MTASDAERDAARESLVEDLVKGINECHSYVQALAYLSDDSSATQIADAAKAVRVREAFAALRELCDDAEWMRPDGEDIDMGLPPLLCVSAADVLRVLDIAGVVPS